MKKQSNLIESIRIIVKQTLLILVSLGIATIFLWLSGYEPFAVVNGMWSSFTTDIAGTIRWATPLILAGLAVCITFKAEVWNLGIDGQIYMGGAAAAAVALALPETNSFVAVTQVILAGMIGGMLFAMIPALLKVFFNTNEVVSTLLLNFIAIRFVEYLISGPMRDPTSITKLNASEKLPRFTWMPRLEIFNPSPTNIGVYFAIIAAIVVAFIFFKTKLGYEIKIIGTNAILGVYGGMKPKLTTVMVMAISGALSGLIGVIEVAAVQHRLINGFNPSFGFDGIVVSLLANHNPIGILLTGVFFGNLRNAGIIMERLTETPSAITDIVMAIVILIITSQIALPKIKELRKRMAMKKKTSPDVGN
ncbi:MAG: ABC transporter permease [Anaerolineaceae bacterium]